MEPETRYAFIAALEVTAPGVVLFMGLCLAAAALVGWLLSSIVSSLAALLVMPLFQYAAERLLVRPAERAAEAEAREMRLLAPARPPTGPERLACAIARGCVSLLRRPQLQIAVAGFSLTFLVIGGLTNSVPVILCSAAPVPVAAAAYGFMGLFLPRSAFEENADVQEALKSLKVKSLFRLRLGGMMVAMALPSFGLAMLILLLGLKFIPHP